MDEFIRISFFSELSCMSIREHGRQALLPLQRLMRTFTCLIRDMESKIGLNRASLNNSL